MVATPGELDGAPQPSDLAALAEAAERVLGGGIAGDVASVGAGGSGAAVVLRAALHAYDRTGRSAFATDLGRQFLETSRLLTRLRINDHWAQLFSNGAEVSGVVPRVEALAVLRIGALDGHPGDGGLGDLLKRVSPGGAVLADGADARVVAKVDDVGTFLRLITPGDADLVQWTAT